MLANKYLADSYLLVYGSPPDSRYPGGRGMSTIIAFVSQKGGVGKSTLARALAREAAVAGLKTKIADRYPAGHFRRLASNPARRPH
jgi:AAA domain